LIVNQFRFKHFSGEAVKTSVIYDGLGMRHAY
jgi:hypothetical protein